MNNNEIKTDSESFAYIGFWSRLGASIIDSVAIILVIYPILHLIYGEQYFNSEASFQGILDFIISFVFPIVATILFWIYKSATPGKIALSIKIVDAKTGERPTVKQSIIRYIGYYISMLPLFLGFIWIAFDAKKQGWHDKMAGTVVISSSDSSD